MIPFRKSRTELIWTGFKGSRVKKIRLSILIVLILFLSSSLFVSTSYCNSSLANMWIYVNEQILETSVKPIIINGRTMVPLRDIFEALGADVEWKQDTREIIGVKGTDKIVLRVGSNKASVNGSEVMLDEAPIILQGRTLVPLRFISENLGAKVYWSEEYDLAKQKLMTIRIFQGVDNLLFYADYIDDLDLLDQLLNNGANPNYYFNDTTFGPVSPFYTSIATGDLEAVRLYVAHGADVNFADSTGTTPLDVAVYQTALITSDESIDILMLILNSGADYDDKTFEEYRKWADGIAMFLDDESIKKTMEDIILIMEALNK